MVRVAAWARWIASIALGIGYLLLAHHTNTQPGNETLGLLVALAPLLLLSLSIAWRAPSRSFSLAIFAVGILILISSWGIIAHHYSRIYWLEHAGTQLFLCLLFARSLRHGREPMCTYFAKIVKDPLLPEITHYTRQVTVAWVIFFGAMAFTSTLIFFTMPITVWSTFANFFTAPLTALMFIVEYAVRRYVHPDVEHVHILAVVKALWNPSAGR